eukprot:1150842-Pelagomonas_calceolata.AAC.8
MEISLASGSAIEGPRLWGGHVSKTGTKRRGGQTPSQMLKGMLGCMVADTQGRQGRRMKGRGRRDWEEGGIQILEMARNTKA